MPFAYLRDQPGCTVCPDKELQADVAREDKKDNTIAIVTHPGVAYRGLLEQFGTLVKVSE